MLERIKSMFDETHEVVGWLGMILILFAYSGISSGYFVGGDVVYQGSNLCGSVALLYSAAKTKSYAVVALNVVWALVAVSALLTM